MRRALALVALMAVAATLTGCSKSPSMIQAPAEALTAKDVVLGLRARGQPVGEYVDYTAENDPNNQLGRPNGYTSKINFRDKRLTAEGDKFGTDNGGSVEVFATQNDAAARYRYIRNIAQSAPIFNEYDYREGKYLLRLSRRLTPNQAAQYQAALKATVSGH